MGDQRVVPHILRKDLDPGREQIAVATVDGENALIVPVSEERAHSVIGAMGFEDMEASPTTVEEIEQICDAYEIRTVGLFGLEDGEALAVFSVETVGLVLEAD
jgi:hypothetical protein